jgi:hypothetical protein
MHVDIWETDAWLGMLEGEKTFTLYHPAHRKYLEVGDNVWPDLLRPPDVNKFPEQSKAVPAQTLLRAGEIIYIPRKWPHHAVAQSASISLTLNFAPTAVKTAVMQHVVPYAKNRGRCQMLLGRNLRAADNLMQLCIHGGTIRYADFKDAVGSKKSNNPMGGSADSAESPSSSDEEDSEDDEEGEAGQGGSQTGVRNACGDKDTAAASATREWARLVAVGWENAAATCECAKRADSEAEVKHKDPSAADAREALRVG